MILHFGKDFDGKVLSPLQTNTIFCGEKSLLHLLETHLGLSGYPNNTEYLRIELYRQALTQQLQAEEDAFFKKSFEADRFATATALLEWRDELLLAGWDFTHDEDTPARLRTLAGTEAFYHKKIQETPANVQAIGYADRFHAALETLRARTISFEKIVLHEKPDWLPKHVQRFVKTVLEKNIPIETADPILTKPTETNLGWLQSRLSGNENGKKDNHNDGSLLILKMKRETDAAAYLAQLLRQNPEMRPTFLLPERNLTIEQALVQEGFPPMGILSASLARPSLQVLKLAPAFLWEPVDIFKIMEFVTLSVKPMDDGLSHLIGKSLAEKPGLFNDTWFARIYNYFDEAETGDVARKQYDFWFDRRRYKSDGTALKRDIINIYDHLQEWAMEQFEKNNSKNTSLLVLAEQARRIRDLLEAIPETRLAYLDLERIVRTIYEPAPVQFDQEAKQHFDYVHSAGAFATPVKTLIWWNCTHNDPTPTPDKWTKSERGYLATNNIELDYPKQKNDLRLFLRNRPVLATTERLIIFVPEYTDGKETQPNLLLGDIEAAFKNPHCFTFNPESKAERAALEEIMAQPQYTYIDANSRTGEKTKPHLPLNRPEAIPPAEYETLTNLENLFYYPHTWFFRQKLRLFPASILSVTKDTTLLGNLAHRFFEILFHEDFQGWTQQALNDWIDKQAETLLEREGATLLLYGREPDKNRFLNRLKKAAWSLITLIKDNGWEVLHTEHAMEGLFSDVPVRGKADLVLKRGDEHAIIDLKWRGTSKRKDMINNYADLQLVMYSRLFPPLEKWPHTAYFILEDRKMVARNNFAFKEADIAGKTNHDHLEANQLILDRMEKTFLWRMEQLKKGFLEIRTQKTASELDLIYAEQALDLLEMKTENSRWDDYRTLVQ